MNHLELDPLKGVPFLDAGVLIGSRVSMALSSYCYMRAKLKSREADTAKAWSKSALGERPQETPEPQPRAPVISPGFTERLRNFFLSDKHISLMIPA